MKQAIKSPALQEKLIPRLADPVPLFPFLLFVPFPVKLLIGGYCVDLLRRSWELGCRRITPGLPYLQAVQQSNVDVIRCGIVELTDQGIVTDNHELHNLDVIICATGFNTSFNRYEIIGRDGVSLSNRWQLRGPEAYLGTTVAGFPNYFSIYNNYIQIWYIN